MGEIRRPYSVHSDCKLAIRRYACFTVFQRCLAESISFNKVCRSACFDIKDSCSTFEDCVDAPASQCSGVYSDANKIELSAISLLFALLAIVCLL
jgi:hypothetical protein